LSAIYCTPGPANSNLISKENPVPINPENNAKIKYKVPISFALDDKNHLSCHSVGSFHVNHEDLLLSSSFLVDVENAFERTVFWNNLR